MATRGGKREGAGRKTNAVKALEAGFICKSFSQKIQEIKWKQFLNSSDENVQLKAAIYLSDRLYGKAPQSLNVDATITSKAARLEHIRAVLTGVAPESE